MKNTKKVEVKKNENKCPNYKMANKQEAEYRGWCTFCSIMCNRKDDMK